MRNVLAVIGLLALSGGGVSMITGVLIGNVYSGGGDIPLIMSAGGLVAMLLGIALSVAYDMWSK